MRRTLTLILAATWAATLIVACTNEGDLEKNQIAAAVNNYMTYPERANGEIHVPIEKRNDNIVKIFFTEQMFNIVGDPNGWITTWYGERCYGIAYLDWTALNKEVKALLGCSRYTNSGWNFINSPECTGVPIVYDGAPPAGPFDTGESSSPYPSIAGTHKGKITPSHDVVVGKMYTYPCPGTGGHSKSIVLKKHGYGSTLASGTWTGYPAEYITITPSVTLFAGDTYTYTIVTGSYPQIFHTASKEVTGGTITCSSFVGANGTTYSDWIPAIRFAE